MQVLDANVVLGIHRADHPHHAVLRRWLHDLAGGTEPISVPVIVWASFLRLATKRRVLSVPTLLADAFVFVEAVCAHPRYLLLGSGPRQLELLRRLCEESDATGDLVADAVLAAIALEHGCAVASLDRDFAGFSSIAQIVPGAG